MSHQILEVNLILSVFSLFRPQLFYLGAGAISSTLITSTGRTPNAVLGKPNQTMMDCIIAR